MSGLPMLVCPEQRITHNPLSVPSLRQEATTRGVRGDHTSAMREKQSDAVLILDEYLSISYYNQEFSQLESADESSYLGKNLMQCFFRIIPPSMYEYIVTIVTGMVIRKTETIHTHDQNYCCQYQILGTIHGNGRPGIIILIKHEPENLCT